MSRKEFLWVCVGILILCLCVVGMHKSVVGQKPEIQSVATPGYVFYTDQEWILTPFPIVVGSMNWVLEVSSELRRDSVVITSTVTIFDGCVPPIWGMETPDPIPPTGVCDGSVPTQIFDVVNLPPGIYEHWIRLAWVSTDTSSDPRRFVLPWEPSDCDLRGANCTVTLSEDKVVIPSSCYARLMQCGTWQDDNGFWLRDTYVVQEPTPTATVTRTPTRTATPTATSTPIPVYRYILPLIYKNG